MVAEGQLEYSCFGHATTVATLLWLDSLQRLLMAYAKLMHGTKVQVRARIQMEMLVTDQLRWYQSSSPTNRVAEIDASSGRHGVTKCGSHKLSAICAYHISLGGVRTRQR